MADYVSCKLHLIGELNTRQVEQLSSVLGANAAQPASDHTNITAALLNGGNSFYFSDVRWGQLEDLDGLKPLIDELSLSYAWAWNGGMSDDFLEGITFFNAATGETKEYHAIGDEIVLTLGQAEELDNVANARAWQNWFEEGKLEIKL